MGLSRLVAVPDLFRRLPRAVQDPLAYRAIRPAGAAWLRPAAGGRPDPPRPRGRGARRGRATGCAWSSTTGQPDGRPRPVRHRLPGRRHALPVPGAGPGRGGADASAATRVLRPGHGVVRARPALPRRAGRLELRADHAVRRRRLVRRAVAGPPCAGAATGAQRRARVRRRRRAAMTRRAPGPAPRTAAAGCAPGGRRRGRRRLPGARHRPEPRPARDPGRACSTTSCPSPGPRATSHRHVRVPRPARPRGRARGARRAARRRFGLARVGPLPDPGGDGGASPSHRDELAPAVPGADPGLLGGPARAWDKRETYRLAEHARHPGPRGLVPASEADLAEVDASGAGGRQARHQGALLLRDQGQGLAGRRPGRAARALPPGARGHRAPARSSSRSWCPGTVGHSSRTARSSRTGRPSPT